ncbi:MAG: S8 family serine peptidase [Bacteroidota bacterium]
MRILPFVFLLLALSFGGLLTAQPATNFAANEVIVKLADLREVADRNRNAPTSTGLTKLDALCRQFGQFEVRNLLGGAPEPKVKKRNRPATDRLIILRYANAVDVDKLVQELAQSTLVAYAEPNYVGKHASSTSADLQVDELIPNDYNSTVWWAKNDGSFGGYPSGAPNPVVDADIDATDAWEITTGSSSVTMAVLDTGIDPTNDEFSGRIVTGYDFVNNDNNPIDDHAHGTNVTGLATMMGNNNFGLVGVDWQCRIMPVKVLDDENLGFYSDFTSGIIYAVDNGADVINMSLGGSSFSQTLLNAVQYAYANDVVVVAAMMNDDSNVRRYPAAYSEVISVGATDLNDFRVRGAYTGGSWGSNYGDHIDVVAPGNSMLSTRYNDNQAFNFWMGGTSQATPLVAGTASLLLGIDPSLSIEEIRTIIRSTAEDQVGASSEDTPGYDIYHGAGRLNTYQAVLMAS